MKRLLPILIVLVMGSVTAPADAGIPFATKGFTSNYIFQDTRTRDLDSLLYQSDFFPNAGDHIKATTVVHLYPFDPRVLGMPRAKGTATVDYSCFPQGGATDRRVDRGRTKFDRFGNAAIVGVIEADDECLFTRAETSFGGNQRRSAGSSVSVTNVLQRLPPGASADCFDPNTMCLLNGRFKATLDWADTSSTGAAVPIATGFDSGLFYFFDSAASAIAVSVLDTCDEFDAFSFFARGATSDLGWELTVTDTETGAIKTYTNPLGMAAEAVTDTAAFATCP